MAGIRELRPDEYDADGVPAFSVVLDFLNCEPLAKLSVGLW